MVAGVIDMDTVVDGVDTPILPPEPLALIPAPAGDVPITLVIPIAEAVALAVNVTFKTATTPLAMAVEFRPQTTQVIGAPVEHDTVLPAAPAAAPISTVMPETKFVG